MSSRTVISNKLKRGILRTAPNAWRKKIVMQAVRRTPQLPLENIKEARKKVMEVNQKAPKLPYSGSIRDGIAGNPKRDTPVRIYTPAGEGPFPAVIYLHGGGFSLGNIEMTDNICRLLSEKSESVVISVDYALSPEYKFPFALEECYEVVNWVEDHAERLQVHTSQLIIAGDSAGGNLTAALSMKLLQENKQMPAGQILICPSLDLITDAQDKLEGMEEILLSEYGMKKFHGYYLETSEDGRDPYASPLFAEENVFASLPPSLIITAGLDPLAEEAADYAGKLRDAGVKVKHSHYEELFHDFVTFIGIIDEAETALMEAVNLIRQSVHS
ncbi:alpha/beta hydrolase [Alkalicoccus daliensis]|uniref:Acetyl esterase n=1 Tax=Alkalicoccus daliensis TaxID=745820 RepID=A0A1G9ZEP8_9BACI|nr:alpha/beta hydrolase [Alkalicoccus daliensis]SDN18923.1 acetyl esterase [Alkalicoccus daliensis]